MDWFDTRRSAAGSRIAIVFDFSWLPWGDEGEGPKALDFLGGFSALTVSPQVMSQGEATIHSSSPPYPAQAETGVP